ncbi:MAG TPA: hypothetical protein VES20_00530 [Bryobacteraceae bacterium]|nr:hypothetical protein [Bryobacteraceae bacterium]
MLRKALKRFGAIAACSFVVALQLPGATLVNNGGFEAGLSGWTAVDQLGSEGTFLVQSGGSSPVSNTPVPIPPEGTNAAMTDAFGPGSHVLYQDFVVPAGVPNAVITFSLYLNNAAPDFFNPGHLDFAGVDRDPDLRINQQVRVDLMTATADPFSVAPADILMNLFQTAAGDPLVSGYHNYSADVTALMQAYQGQTLRLRFAEVDNVLTLNLGVDNVAVTVSAIPEPSTFVLSFSALAAVLLARRKLRN